MGHGELERHQESFLNDQGQYLPFIVDLPVKNGGFTN